MERESRPFEETIKNMEILGLWPKRATKHYRLKYCVLLVVVSSFLIACLLHFIVALEDRSEVSVSTDISIILDFVGLDFMSLNFVWQQRKIVALWEGLVKAGTFGPPDGFHRKVGQLNLLSKIYFVYCLAAEAMFCASKIYIEKSRCLELNLAKGLNEICGVIFPTWMPFDMEVFPRKHILIGLQSCAIFVFATGNSVITLSTYEAAEYILLKIKHLQRLLREVCDGNEQQIKMNLVHCIKYHQHIISLQVDFNKHIKYRNGCYLVTIAMIFASFLDQMQKEKSLVVVLVIVQWTICFFIVCYSGQQIFSESLNVADAAFASRWYESSVSLQKEILVLMARAQRPFRLKAVPIGTMNYDIFIAMLKTSYSYYTVLRQTL